MKNQKFSRRFTTLWVIAFVSVAPAQSLFSMDSDCNGPQGLFLEFQSASATRNKCTGFAPYQTTSPPTRHLVETATESADPLVISETISALDAIFEGRRAACNGTVTLQTSFVWAVAGGHTNASVTFRILRPGSGVVTNQTVPLIGGSSGPLMVAFPIVTGDYPSIEVNAHTPSGSSSITFQPTATMGSIVSTYMILTNSGDCSGPASSGALVTFGYGSGWVTNSPTSKYLTNSPTFTPARITYQLTDEYTTSVLETLGRNNLDTVAPTAFAARGVAGFVTAKRNLASNELSVSLRKVRTRMSFLSIPGQLYKLQWIEVSARDNSTIAGYVHKQMEVLGAESTETTTVTNDWIAPPVFNGEVSIKDPSVELARQCSTCEAGSGTLAVDGVHLELNLGSGGFDQAMGGLVLHQQSPVNLGNPALIQIVGHTNFVEIIRLDGILRQVKSPQMLANLVVLSNSPGNIPVAYRVDCYSPTNAGTKGTNGLYQPLNSPFVAWTIANLNASATNCFNLLVLETRGSRTITNTYAYSTNDNTAAWSLTAGNGLRVQFSADNFGYVSSNFTEKIIIENSSGHGSAMHRHFGLFPTGSALELLKTSESNATRVIQFGYDPSGRLSQLVGSDGRWTKYSYDSAGRISAVQTPFMNSSISSGLKRELAFDYTPISGSGDTGRDPLIPRWTTENIYPVFGYTTIVGSKFTVLGNGWRKDIDGYPWNGANSQVTLTTFYTNGDFKDKIKSIDFPDATRALFFHQTNANTRTTTIVSGEADPANSTNVLSGSRSIVVVGRFGEPLAVTNHYFSAAGTVLTGLKTYEYLDDIGKSHLCRDLDGTTRRVQYACCGLEHIEEADGTSQWFYYDDLKRLTSIQSLPANITVVNRLDGLGRVVNTTQYGSNGTPRFLYGASYDAGGRISRETNALGGATSYGYSTNANGQYTITATNADQGTRIQTFAREGSLYSIDGTAAFPMRFETQLVGPLFQSHTFLTTKIGTDGASSEWERETLTIFGTPTQIQRPYPSGGGTVARSFSYNYAKGQLTRIDDEEGVRTMFAYDALGRLDTRAFDRDNDSAITYAGLDRISKNITDAVTNSSGVAVLRQRTYVWETDNSSASNLVGSIEVSSDGLTSWQTVHTAAVSLTNSSQTAYYSNGLVLVTLTSPDQSQRVLTNQFGRLRSTTLYDSANPRQKIGQTLYGYDEFGRQNTVTDERNGTTTYFFNNAGQVSGIRSPAVGGVSLSTTNYFDLLGRIWKTTLPDGTSVTNEFYPTGLLRKTSGSRTYPVEYTYDPQGRIKTMVTSGAFGPQTNTWLYNANRGWLDKRVFPGGSGPSYTYDNAGRPLTRTWVRNAGVNPIATGYSYNSGDLVQITYSDSTPVTFFRLNRLGQITNIVVNGVTTRRKFDRLGNPLGESCSGGTLDGISLTNQYDSLLRRTNVCALNGGITLANAGYGYDAASRLQTVSQLTAAFPSASATYRYVSSSPLVESIAFTNNGAARLTLNKTFDALERLTSISSVTPQSAAVDAFHYKYNTANQRAGVTNEANAYWVYQYDSLGQVTSARRHWPDGTPVAGQQYDFAYDQIGNLTATATGGDSSGQNLRPASYTPNARNQYTSRTVPGYVETLGTAHSNSTVTVNFTPTSRHGEFFRGELALNNSVARWQGITNIGVLNDGTNADIVTTNVTFTFLPATPETFLYDPDGNLTSDGRFAYTWDAENRLLTAISPTNIPTAARRRLTFEYDWAGRRIRMDASRWTNNNWSIIEAKKFCYDGWNLVAELNATNNALLRSYAWGLDLSDSMTGAGGVGGLLWINDATTFTSNTIHFATFDGNGNVSSLVNAGDGAITAKYEYGPFGDLLQASGPLARINPIRWSSKYQDNESGLIYYGYRFYSPGLQRWLNRDPLEELGGLNLYGFVNNNPLSLVDKDGRVVPLLAGLLVGAAIDAGLSILEQWLTKDPCKDEWLDSSKVGKDVAIGAALTVGTLGFYKLYELYKANKLLRTLEEAVELGVKGHYDDLAGMVAKHGDEFGDALAAYKRANATAAEVRNARHLAREKTFGGLGDATTSPWLNDRRIAVRMHLESFRGGGSFLIPKSAYERRMLGQTVVGRKDGVYIANRAAMDRLLAEAGGNLTKVKQRLGIPSQYWNEELMRVDVLNPLLHNIRMPSGLESGANELFRWGGYTSGGLSEAVIDQVPIAGIRVTPIGIRPK